METKEVRAGRDTILGYVERASPVDILAELIWNALDAEAMNVEVTVAFSALGAPEEIVVRDDGHGMSHDRAPELFLTHGESWKRTDRFSPNINRPLHGQLGRGRFLAYGVADRVEWRSISANSGTFGETVILGNRAAPNKFTFDGPRPSAGSYSATPNGVAQPSAGRLPAPLTNCTAPVALGIASDSPEVIGIHMAGRRS